ncbi:MAG: methyltransferase domain-containing protein [bacterium]
MEQDKLYIPDRNGIIRTLPDELSEINRKRISKFGTFMFMYDYVQNHWVRPRLHKADPKRHQQIMHEMIAPVKNTLVLDLACGTGAAIPYIDKSNTYTGIDISYPMLKQAAKKAQFRGFSQYKLIEGNAEQLLFKNETFTVVLIDTSLHMIQKYQKCIAEAARVLKKDGFLICSCPTVGINREFDTLWEKIASKRHLHSLKESDFKSVCCDNGLQYKRIGTNGGVLYFYAFKQQ